MFEQDCSRNIHSDNHHIFSIDNELVSNRVCLSHSNARRFIPHEAKNKQIPERSALGKLLKNKVDIENSSYKKKKQQMKSSRLIIHRKNRRRDVVDLVGKTVGILVGIRWTSIQTNNLPIVDQLLEKRLSEEFIFGMMIEH